MNIERRTLKVGKHHQLLFMEGISTRDTFYKEIHPTSNVSQYNDTDVYLYFLMSILKGLLGKIMKMGNTFFCFIRKKIVFSQVLQLPAYKINFFI
jgi:hypothetical protein